MRRNRNAKEVEETEIQEEMENAADGEGAGADSGGTAENARVQQLEAELAEAKDRYLRSLADMDNVRRRARMDAEEARKFANENLITELLPVLDNLTRALEAAEQTTNLEALQSGVEQIRRQFSDVLTRAGVEPIQALNQPFDPNLHEAIMQVEPQEGQEPHQVVEELRAGYKLNDRVVRPSLVKVTSG